MAKNDDSMKDYSKLRLFFVFFSELSRGLVKNVVVKNDQNHSILHFAYGEMILSRYRSIMSALLEVKHEGRCGG